MGHFVARNGVARHDDSKRSGRGDGIGWHETTDWRAGGVAASSDGKWHEATRRWMPRNGEMARAGMAWQSKSMAV